MRGHLTIHRWLLLQESPKSRILHKATLHFLSIKHHQMPPNSSPKLYHATRVIEQKFYQQYIKALSLLQKRGLWPDSTSLQQPFYTTSSLPEFPYVFRCLFFGLFWVFFFQIDREVILHLSPLYYLFPDFLCLPREEMTKPNTGTQSQKVTSPCIMTLSYLIPTTSLRFHISQVLSAVYEI